MDIIIILGLIGLIFGFGFVVGLIEFCFYAFFILIAISVLFKVASFFFELFDEIKK
jgi:hypothetical protein